MTNAHYTDVTLWIAGSQVATATKADLGLPTDTHRYIVNGVKWAVPPKMRLDYLQRDCQIRGTGPAGSKVNITAKITGINASGSPVHLN